jgi:hypothetical protein
MSDAISRLLADAYVARHATPATGHSPALEEAARFAADTRAAALERVLADLRRGVEPRDADVDPLWADPAAHLRYLDARDEALALHGGRLRWDRGPRPGDTDDEA